MDTRTAVMTTTYYDPDNQPYAKRLRSSAFRDKYLRNREYGYRPKYGDESRLHCEMYSSIYPIAKWEYEKTHYEMDDPGGIFNLDFSPYG